jgi:predicted DNA-binding protein
MTNHLQGFGAMDRDDLDETISTRFPAKVRQRIEALAQADDRRPSQIVRRIVLRALREDGGEAA